MIGIVTNIYRDGDPRRPDGDPPIPCLYVTVGGVRDDPDPAQRSTIDLVATYSGDPPPPLSICRFTDDVLPHCLGTLDIHVEEIVRDHFTYVTGTEPDLGDGSWNLTVTGGGVGADGGAQVGGAVGVTRIQSRDTVNAATYISKNADMLEPDAANAFWVACRFRLGSTATNIRTEWGLTKSSSSDSDWVAAFFSTADGFSATNWQLAACKDAAPLFGERAVTALAAAVDGFHTGDLLFVPGTFAALWLDGDGPYAVTTTTSIPTSGDDMTLYFRVMSNSAATRSFDVDAIGLSSIRGPLANPDHELLTL